MVRSPHTHTHTHSSLSPRIVYDILRHDVLVLSRSAVGLLERMLAPPKSLLQPEYLKGPFDYSGIEEAAKEKRNASGAQKDVKRAEKNAARRAAGKNIYPPRPRSSAIPAKPVEFPVELPPRD